MTVIVACAECDAKNRNTALADRLSFDFYGHEFNRRRWASVVEVDKPETELDFTEDTSFRRALTTDWAWA